MNVKQLSVFIENKAGRVSEVTDVLGLGGSQHPGFSVSDTADYGIVRLIVDDPDKGHEVLTAAGFTVKESDVICVRSARPPRRAGRRAQGRLGRGRQHRVRLLA